MNSELDKPRRCEKCSSSFSLRDHGEEGLKLANYPDSQPGSYARHMIFSRHSEQVASPFLWDYCPKCVGSASMSALEDAIKLGEEVSSWPFWRRWQLTVVTICKLIFRR